MIFWLLVGVCLGVFGWFGGLCLFFEGGVAVGVCFCVGLVLVVVLGFVWVDGFGSLVVGVCGWLVVGVGGVGGVSGELVCVLCEGVDLFLEVEDVFVELVEVVGVGVEGFEVGVELVGV